MQKQETEINEGVVDRREEKQNGDPNENQIESKGKEQPLKRNVKFTSKYLTQNLADHEQDEKGKPEKMSEETERNKVTELLVKHLFENVSNEKEVPLMAPKSKNTVKAEFWQNRVAAGIDFVPALRSRGWPKVAQEWIKRERKWPSPDMIDRAIQEGFHLVGKPPKNGGNPDCDFRISFSHAEYLLSQDMNDTQRECYRCLKKFHRAYLSKEPEGLVSFHLKNILLRTIEETGVEMWTESNRAECLMELLGNLLEALTKKDLRHFFVRSYNLFGVDYIESPKILESLAGKVKQIMKYPMQFAKGLIGQKHVFRRKSKRNRNTLRKT